MSRKITAILLMAAAVGLAASCLYCAATATDAVIIDERAWSALDTATRVRLLSAVDAGLGLLLRLGSTPSAAVVAQWRELGLPLESADLAPAVRLPGEAGDAASAVRRLPLRAVGSDGIALARDSGSTALAVARNRGQGRLGVWWLYDTRTLVSGGEGALHDALWANAIDRLARPRQTAPPTAPPHAWEHERNDLCAREADVHVDAPSGETTVVLTQRGTDGQWCGGFWPRRTRHRPYQRRHGTMRRSAGGGECTRWLESDWPGPGAVLGSAEGQHRDSRRHDPRVRSHPDRSWWRRHRRRA